MNKNIIYSIKSGMTGISIGFLISLGFSLASNSNYLPSIPSFANSFSNTSIATMVSAILWFLFGMFCYWLGRIYKINKWNLLKKTVVHAVILYLVMICLGLAAGWFYLYPLSVITFTIVFILIYFICWYISYTHIKREIMKINHSLKSK
ncbi:DUF3021 domain-containing protein [Lactobacillaceae bacterium Melli_B4]